MKTFKFYRHFAATETGAVIETIVARDEGVLKLQQRIRETVKGRDYFANVREFTRTRTLIKIRPATVGECLAEIRGAK